MRTKKNKLLRYALLFVVLFLHLPVSAGVSTTKHNLSITGTGQIRASIASNETEVCVFCHTPHNASPAAPLWNHEITSVQTYTNFYSDTLFAYTAGEAPPIDGYSRLCLSCHDGTIAVGAILTKRGTIEMDTIENIVEAGRLMPDSPGYLGTDLSGSHPLSFIYDENLVNIRNAEPGIMHLNWPIRKYGDKFGTGDPDVRIYPTQGGYGVQCTSCHDPHGGKGNPDEPPFWRKPTYDDVCLVCHDISSTIGH